MKSILTVAILLALVAGCRGSKPTPDAADPGGRADPTRGGKDPVAGDWIQKQKPVQREYNGSVFYFRDKAEAEAFDAHPVAYVIRRDSSVSDEDSQGTVRPSSAHSR
jgi:YHS domain-containing protein